jgi:hypothetical protein
MKQAVRRERLHGVIRRNSEDRTLHSHRCEHLKFYISNEVSEVGVGSYIEGQKDK